MFPTHADGTSSRFGSPAHKKAQSKFLRRWLLVPPSAAAIGWSGGAVAQLVPSAAPSCYL